MGAVGLLLFISAVLLACIAYAVTRLEHNLQDVASGTRLILINQGAIRKRLKQMPSITDLDQAVADAKAAVDAAAQRVIDAAGNAVPQASIDNVNAIKADADAISPA